MQRPAPTPEEQKHIAAFDRMLTENQYLQGNALQAAVDFARKLYDPRAETAKFSSLLHHLNPVWAKHEQIWLEREVRRLTGQ